MMTTVLLIPYYTEVIWKKFSMMNLKTWWVVEINIFYEIDNLVEECMLWYNVRKNKNISQSEMKNISLISLLDEANLYPAIHIALTIALILLVTT